jgi:hypothetical protein
MFFRAPRSGSPLTWVLATIFGRKGSAPEPDGRFELTFEKILGGRGGYNRWTINGKSWPDTDPLFTVEQGKRYRLAMNNKSGGFPKSCRPGPQTAGSPLMTSISPPPEETGCSERIS